MTMIQQVMISPKEIIFKEIPIPEINDDQVLLQIRHIIYLNIHSMYPITSYPVSQGHKL